MRIEPGLAQIGRFQKSRVPGCAVKINCVHEQNAVRCQLAEPPGIEFGRRSAVNRAFNAAVLEQSNDEGPCAVVAARGITDAYDYHFSCQL